MASAQDIARSALIISFAAGIVLIGAEELRRHVKSKGRAGTIIHEFKESYSFDDKEQTSRAQLRKKAEATGQPVEPKVAESEPEEDPLRVRSLIHKLIKE